MTVTTEPTTATGRKVLRIYGSALYDDVLGIEAEVRAEAARLVDSVIFDVPIGDDVTYSRGYSAGTAAARESLREALR